MQAEPRRSERGLGRGLASLIPVSSPGVSDVSREIALADIRPNPAQPRQTFDEDALRSLVESIAEHGVLQPVLVMQVPDGYVLIAGERRVRAAEAAGLSTIPAVVRTANEQETARARARREPPARGPQRDGGGARLPAAHRRVRADPGAGRAGACRAVATGDRQHAAAARPRTRGPGGRRGRHDQRRARPRARGRLGPRSVQVRCSPS